MVLLQVNLSDSEINSKYQEIVNTTSSTDWVIKVQTLGDGGLDKMVDRFMDSWWVLGHCLCEDQLWHCPLCRIQYGFVHVKDPNVGIAPICSI